jgi:uncharacterized protein HemX
VPEAGLSIAGKTLLAAVIPLALGGVATIAWQNSHMLTSLSRDQAELRRDLDHLTGTLTPSSTLMQRFDNDERELTRLRTLVEQRTPCPPGAK